MTSRADNVKRKIRFNMFLSGEENEILLDLAKHYKMTASDIIRKLLREENQILLEDAEDGC